jgi:hypothetical protein
MTDLVHMANALASSSEQDAEIYDVDLRAFCRRMFLHNTRNKGKACAVAHMSLQGCDTKNVVGVRSIIAGIAAAYRRRKLVLPLVEWRSSRS